MNKLLFINSPSRDNSRHFPHGPAILTAVLKKNSFDYDIFDGNFESEKSFIDLLKENKYEFIAISGIITTYKYQKTIISLARKYNPYSVIMSGGGLASAVGHTLLELIPQLDICSISEGEKTIIDIIKNYKDKPGQIKGIIYRDRHNIIRKNDAVNFIENMDEIPIPDYKGWNLNRYLDYKSTYRRTSKMYSRKVDILTSRGCAFSCDFCFNSLGREKVRYRSIDLVISEMIFLINNYGINYFNFMDENFLINKNFVLSFIERVKEYSLDIKFAISARADTININILKELHKIGCELIYIGIESGSNTTLKKMNKKASVKENFNAFIRIVEANIIPVPTIMIGYDHETPEELQNNYHFIDSLVRYGTAIEDKKIKSVFLKGIKNILPIYYATPYPGSQLYERNKNRMPNLETVLESISNKDASHFTFNLSDIEFNQLVLEHKRLENYIRNITLTCHE